MHIKLTSLEDTAQLARIVASHFESGEVVLLKGDLGSGKTEFARHVIRALTTPEQIVPSPTFTIVQAYDDDRGEIWHLDLYRIEDPEEAFELGLEEALAEHRVMIEWFDKLGTYPFRNALTLDFSLTNDTRTVSVSHDGAWSLCSEEIRKHFS